MVETNWSADKQNILFQFRAGLLKDARQNYKPAKYVL
jgi:hypothetical protein